MFKFHEPYNSYSMEYLLDVFIFYIFFNTIHDYFLRVRLNANELTNVTGYL